MTKRMQGLSVFDAEVILKFINRNLSVYILNVHVQIIRPNVYKIVEYGPFLYSNDGYPENMQSKQHCN